MRVTNKKIANFFFDFAFKAAKIRNSEKLLNYLLDFLLQLFDAEYGSVMLYSPNEECLQIFCSAGHPGGTIPKKVPIGEGIAGKVFQTGKTIIAKSVFDFPDQASLRRPRIGGSFISLPLKIMHKKIIGVLNIVRSTQKPGFTEADEKKLFPFLGQIAEILEKSYWIDKVIRREQELESLYVLIKILNSNQEMQTVLRKFLETLAKLYSLEKSAILRLIQRQNTTEKFEIVVSHRLSNKQLQQMLKSIEVSLKENFDENTLYKNSTSESEYITPVSLSFNDGKKLNEFFCFPLPINVENAPRYFFIVSRKRLSSDPDTAIEHYRLLDILAKELRTTIERFEMIEQIKADKETLKESNFFNSLYLEISKELSSTLDPHTVMQRAFEQFGVLIPFASIGILLYDDIEGYYQIIFQPYGPVSAKYFESVKSDIINTVSEFPLDPPIDKSRVLKVHSYPPQNPHAPFLQKFRQKATIPIILGEKVLGLIHLVNRNGGPISSKELDITLQFTSIFLTSIKNAIIHRRTEKLAYTDPLTGLYNHRYFQESLKAEFLRSMRYKAPLSLMIMDIDHFKKFNDCYGHLTGDKVLIHVGKIFEKSIREKIDVAARYGGEEFAVLLPETPIEGAVHFAERIRTAVENTPIESEAGKLKVTLSIGVACTKNGKFQTPTELVDAADKALYIAKENGRNQVKIFEERKTTH